jgi:hypothetical protein
MVHIGPELVTDLLCEHAEPDPVPTAGRLPPFARPVLADSTPLPRPDSPTSPTSTAGSSNGTAPGTPSMQAPDLGQL